MKSGMVKRMLAAALAATLIVTSAGTTDVWAAGSEETVSVSVEETEESTENVKTASSSNLITNGDFETDASGWTFLLGGGDYSPNLKKGTDTGMTNNTTGYINIWSENEAEFVMSQEITGLSAGNYTAMLSIDGANDKTADLKFYAGDESTVLSTENGWNNWSTFKVENIVVDESGSIIIKIAGTLGAGYWFDVDDITLTKNLSDGEEKTEAAEALNTLITACEALTESDYTSDTWSALQTALTSAKAVYGDKDNKTVEELTEAKTVLQAAKDALVDAGIVDTGADGIFVQKVDGLSDDFIKGVDVSSYVSLIDSGVTFKDWNGNVIGDQEFFSQLKEAGVNYVRIRVWNDPYDSNGKGYGGGNNDLAKAKKIGKWATDAGMKVLIDFHYSDFWADPGKQIKPKAWKDFDADQLEQAVYEFTGDSLRKVLEAGVNVTMIQVGNEVTNGLLWPEGLKPNYDNIARFISSGIRACRAVKPEIPLMIHLDNGGNNEMYRDWFDHYMERGEDFDYIGLSYYPFWHGTLQMLEDNMNDMAARYGKELIVAEVSMGYTMEDYKQYEKLKDSERKGYATKPELVAKIEYPMTVQGQVDFTKDFLNRVAHVRDNKGLGFFWWEPAWIPVHGSGWATPASLKYMNDPGPCGNEWANQALFDYDGNVLPALEVIRDFRK